MAKARYENMIRHQKHETTIIVDSALTLEEALVGKDIPQGIKKTLTLLDVEYVSFDGAIHRGQLVVHREVARELHEIFGELLSIGFLIEKTIPVVRYVWDDDVSMEDNNTSAFNYRYIYGTSELSNHSYGLAIDINPALNPYIARDGTIFPRNASQDLSRRGTLVPESDAVRSFTKRGWEWGGDWHRKDWQHFEKKL